MLSVVVTLLVGSIFGLALAAPPGPMNAIIAEESVIHGWLAGFKAGLGAMSADAIFFVLAALGVVTFLQGSPTLHAVMMGVGGVLLLYFAYGAVQDAQSSFQPDDSSDQPNDPGEQPNDSIDQPNNQSERPTGTGFTKAFVLALTNPYQILFWITIGVKMLDPGTLDVLAEIPYVGSSLTGTLVVQTGSPSLVIGFFGGILIWASGFPAALVGAERRVNKLAPVVAGGSALVLAGFGLVFLSRAVNTFVPF
ncbi:LysE family translocator [Halogeometricum borinquense]|uniref:LysE family translocator n=1 Tax=Halogeometricum borinquense TaxID=60847 RepID=A0A6C0UDJ5_9EURY|nr:LysE family translocator [Halogeometricum borinquense]QIB73434.1 LysE family translocator [Halogeometricum borinquense]QIQ77164.1 LysE family translocator [Halogeometricum borinquense]